MNIEQIKRNIAASKNGGVSKTNFNEPGVSDVTPQSDSPPIKKRTRVSPQTDDFINNNFGDLEGDSDNEKCKPNSEVWKPPPHSDSVNLLEDPISRVCRELELKDEKYCWDRKKKKGEKSRKEFTDFLVSAL